MLFFNILQPVQATQTPITFRTPTPAVDPNLTTNSLTFDAQGTASSSDSTEARITNGTFQVTDTRSGQTLYNGSINSGGFTNSTDGGNINAFGDLDYPAGGGTVGISTSCSASIDNDIQFGLPDSNIVFQGVVTCSVGEVNAIAQPSPSPPSSTTGTTNTQDSNNNNSRDSDGDRVPDSSDRCTHNSNPKCFKEGDTIDNNHTTTATFF